MTLPPEQVAYPRSVNDLRKWTDHSSLFKCAYSCQCDLV